MTHLKYSLAGDLASSQGMFALEMLVVLLTMQVSMQNSVFQELLQPVQGNWAEKLN